MFGLFFIYFIGKMFYKLAIEFRQNKWLYGILGVVIYYIGTVVFITLLLLIHAFFPISFLTGLSDTEMGLVSIPGGIAACWGFYKLLEHRWKLLPVPVQETIDDIGVLKDDQEIQTIVMKQ